MRDRLGKEITQLKTEIKEHCMHIHTESERDLKALPYVDSKVAIFTMTLGVTSIHLMYINTQT